MAAGTLLVLLRMLQGFSVGAEFTGSITYATEAAAQGRAGYLSSLAVAGGLLGFSLGSLCTAVFGWLLGPEAMASWGWRLPFLLGAAVAWMGLWMRRGMPETLAAAVTHQDSALRVADLGGPVVALLREVVGQWRLVLQVIGLVTFANVIFYLAFVYLVDLTGTRSGQPAAANTITTVVQLVDLLFVIWGGHLADRHCMVPVNRCGNALLVLLAPIGLLIGGQGQLLQLAMAQVLLVVPVIVTMGAQVLLGVLLVPERQRCAVFSIAYSLAMALFAGTAPLVASWLAGQQWSAWLVPYVLLYGAAALITVQRLRLAPMV